MLVLYFFVQQVLKIDEVDLSRLKISSFVSLFIVVCLMPLNWGLELLKWKKILDVNLLKYSFLKLIRSLFSGVATGLVTPNRLGNFIGRVLFFKGKSRGMLVMGTLYSNFSQFLVTLSFGTIGFIMIKPMLNDVILQYATYFLISVLFFSMLLYHIFPILPSTSFKLIDKKLNLLSTFQQQAKLISLQLIGLSIFRFIVFTLQYVLLLVAFGTPFSLDIVFAILLVYLISTITPSLLFGKLFIRESASLLILGLYIENELKIIVVSLLLWLINIGLPSLTGLVFLLKEKYLRHD